MTLSPLPAGELLRKYGLRPRKSLGQNFLTDPGILSRIVDAAGVTKDDDVLEIGAGLGSLTRHLAVCARSVTAVELDHTLLPILSEVLAPYQNVQLHHGDILDLDPAEILPAGDYLVVANIPYYITSAVIRHLLEASHKPSRLALTMQREVAERICAQAGDMSLLSLSVQVYGNPRVVLRIPAGAFYPPPKVDSAVLRLDLHPQPLIPTGFMDTFFHLIKAGFSQKRKTLRNSLSAGLRLPPARVEEMLGAAAIQPNRRAETLSLDEWRILTEIYQPRDG